jgi:GNAT superfamily N-acetyltransferase
MQLMTLKGDEAVLLKKLWLEMYTDSPTAFGGTLDEMVQRSDEEWRHLAEQLGNSGKAVAYVPYHQGEPCGFVMALNGQYRDGQFHYDRTEIVTLARMWVAPTARRLGIASTMINGVITWAQGLPAETVELWVTQGNIPASTRYRRTGFREMEVTAPLPSQPELSMELMSLDLGSTSSQND